MKFSRFSSRSKQRGFIYLTTGANGAGKTLFTLKDVRELQLKESRPVYYNGRFDLVADFGWTKIDFKDWQDCPDGSIIVVDECHNDMPVRKSGSDVPPHIQMLAEHRRRGFDFFLITQHPMNIDSFVRRIIGPPGWHRHLKNFAGSPLVSHTKWGEVKEDCHKVGANQTGEMVMLARPKEVFEWYRSATLHTAKPKLPRSVFVIAGGIVLAPLLVWLAFKSMQPKPPANSPKSTPASLQAGHSGATGGTSAVHNPSSVPLTPAAYVETFAPRVDGLAYTAPRYDQITQPTQAPYPAACVSGVRRGESSSSCRCYTQQGTYIPVPLDLCHQIVKHGFYVDWASAPPGSPPPGAKPVTAQ